MLWRRMLESVWKDIECYFGRLKQRYKVIRAPNLLKDKMKIDNMMFSIVAVQNMLLDYTIAAEERCNHGRYSLRGGAVIPSLKKVQRRSYSAYALLTKKTSKRRMIVGGIYQL